MEPALTISKGKKKVNYAESEDEEDEDVLKSRSTNVAAGRATKRRKISVPDDSDDEFGMDEATENAMTQAEGR